MSKLVDWHIDELSCECNCLLLASPFEAVLSGVWTGKSPATFDAIGKELETLLKCNIGIKRVVFNPPATIIFWNDNTKTVVKTQSGDQYDPEKGFVIAYLKKLLGNDNTFNKEINKWVDYNVTDKKPKKSKKINKPSKSKCAYKLKDGVVVKGEPFNGVIECVESPYRWWTVGKLYDVKGGYVTANDGDRYPTFGEPYTAEDVIHAGCNENDGGHINSKNIFKIVKVDNKDKYI